MDNVENSRSSFKLFTQPELMTEGLYLSVMDLSFSSALSFSILFLSTLLLSILFSAAVNSSDGCGLVAVWLRTCGGLVVVWLRPFIYAAFRLFLSEFIDPVYDVNHFSFRVNRLMESICPDLIM